MNDLLESEMGRRAVIATGSTVAAAAMMPSPLLAGTRSPGAEGFDFLLGEWQVLHRKLRTRLEGSSDWYSFPGTLAVRPILAGGGNVDENVLEDPAGRYLATSLRVFDPKARRWSVYWIDGRSTGIEKPVIGRFAGRIGRFYNDDEFRGRPIRVRFTYEDLGPGRARWEQAFSPDKGRSWEPNWTMDFTRRENG